MGFPDRIDRTVDIAHPPAKVWAALTTAEGLATWFGDMATIIFAPGAAEMTWTSGEKASMRIERVEEPAASASPGGSSACPTTTLAAPTSSSRLAPIGTGTRLTVIESGFAQLPETLPQGLRRQHRGRAMSWASWSIPRCHGGLTSRRSPRRSSSPWLTRPGGDPGRTRSRRPRHGHGSRHPPADTRQAIAKHLALLGEAGLVVPNRGSGAVCATALTPPRCRWRSSSWPPWPGIGTASSRPSRTISTPPSRLSQHEGTRERNDHE